MSNKYYLQSADEGLVFDIKVPVASGSSLQALVKKTETNQQWTFESVPGQSGYYYIVSADMGLVVDIKTPVASGSGLQALEKKTESNQWWMFESVSGHAGNFYIVSAEAGLVVDIKTPVASGSGLQALEKKTESNQWWSVVSAPGNTFDPKLAPPVTFIQIDPPVTPTSFSVTGTGFPAGHELQLSWLYVLDPEGDPEDSTSETVSIGADISGAFSAGPFDIGAINVVGATLGIKVTDPATGASANEQATWQGDGWSL